MAKVAPHHVVMYLGLLCGMFHVGKDKILYPRLFVVFSAGGGGGGVGGGGVG